MIDSEVTQLPSEPVNVYSLALTIYLRGIATILMGLGLCHWLYIVGLFDDPGWSFETMTTEWQFVTVHLAVVDLAAAVGLWMRVAWGNVLWVYVAVFEIAIHTVFAETFGLDIPIVAFHALSLAGFALLVILERRTAAKLR